MPSTAQATAPRFETTTVNIGPGPGGAPINKTAGSRPHKIAVAMAAVLKAHGKETWPNTVGFLIEQGFTKAQAHAHGHAAHQLAAQPAPDRSPIATRMARTLAAAVDRTGSATAADLERDGFTSAQITRHIDTARARAARLRPDAALVGA